MKIFIYSVFILTFLNSIATLYIDRGVNGAMFFMVMVFLTYKLIEQDSR